MSNQQDLVGQPTSVNFDFAAMSSALLAPEEHPFPLSDRASDGPQIPNFQYCYGPQDNVYISGDGLQDSDAGLSYSAPCPSGSGSANYPQSDLTQEERWVGEAVVILHTMASLFRENLRMIEELLRKRDGLQGGRVSTGQAMSLPHSLHTITPSDADLNGPSELWSHYDMRPGSFSFARDGPCHNDLQIADTTRASSVPVDICMDSENAAAQSPSFKVVDTPSARYLLCQCGHQTKTKGDMLRHHETLKHTQRKYACPHCGTNYTRGDGLKRHQRGCKRRSLM